MGSTELGTWSLLWPQHLSSQSHLPSRQGVDNHSFLSPRWVPADGPDDCYYCYCCYLHRRAGLQISACLVRGGAETQVSGKLQAFKFLSEKTGVHACSKVGVGNDHRYECTLPCRKKPICDCPHSIQTKCFYHVQCFSKPRTTLPPVSPIQSHFCCTVGQPARLLPVFFSTLGPTCLTTCL